MRPRKFLEKPRANSIERYKRTTRITPIVSRIGSSVVGTPQEKVKQVALMVLKKLPLNERVLNVEKKRIFRRNAESALMRQSPIGSWHCAERCNLAIALLNASGVKSWLARVLVMPDMLKAKGWQFHDVVEFADGKNVKHLMFDNKGLIDDFSYAILPGAVDSVNNSASRDVVVFRAVDSKQIGGVGNWNEYKKYTNRLDTLNGLVGEINKNKRRIDLLIREGIIPEDALFYM